VAQQIAGPLVLFPWRFHSDPRSYAEFRPLSEHAALLLGQIDAPASSLAVIEHDIGGQLFRWLLLELSGRRAEAEERLATLEVKCDGCCGNAVEDMLREIDQCRVYAAAMRGDDRTALALLERVENEWFGPALEAVDDASPALLGLLLLEAGRNQEGVSMLQRLVDLSPASTCGVVARAALTQVGALREPEMDRLLASYVDGRAVHRPDQTRAYVAIAALRDARARPLFERTLRRSEVSTLIWESAWGLLALDPADRRPLLRALQRLRMDHNPWNDLGHDSLDARLRAFAGDGPILDADADRTADVALQWQRWLATHPRR
jgi:hypothetical protein